MKNIIRTCNTTIRFSKFTLNIKIYEEFVKFLSKLVWRETLLKKKKKVNSLKVHLMTNDDKTHTLGFNLQDGSKLRVCFSRQYEMSSGNMYG